MLVAAVAVGGPLCASERQRGQEQQQLPRQGGCERGHQRLEQSSLLRSAFCCTTDLQREM